jgi:uncharacterized protein DUF4265
MSASESNLVKIGFPMMRDHDNWPPYEKEWVWASPLGDDLFQLDNSPWYVRGVSWKDIVRAELDADGCWNFIEVVTASRHSTIRVFAMEATEAEMQELLSKLNRLGCTYEGESGLKSMIAIDIPPESDYSPIVALLKEGESAEKWGYEEGCLYHQAR